LLSEFFLQQDGLRVTGCELRVAGYALRGAGCELQEKEDRVSHFKFLFRDMSRAIAQLKPSRLPARHRPSEADSGEEGGKTAPILNKS